MTTPLNLTPELQKHIDAVIAKAVAEALAAQPRGPAVQPIITGKSVGRPERLKAFRRMFGLAIKSAMLAKSAPNDPQLTVLQKAYTSAEKAWQEAVKADLLTPVVFSEGGSLLPEYFSSEIIEVLRDTTVLLQAGARAQTISGKFNIGRLNAAATAQFVMPGNKPTIASPSTGAVILDPKKLMGLLETTGEMIRDPSWNGAEVLTADMFSALGVEADKQGIVGDGSGANPTGLVKQVKTANKNAQTAAFKQANLTSVIADLDKAERLVRESKIPFQGNSPGWVMTSKTLMALKSMRDGAGWVFRQQLDAGTLNGYPVYVTDSISGEGTGGKDLIVFGLFSQLYMGEKDGVMVEMDHSEQFSNDIVVVRGISNLDWKVRHDSAFAVIDEITYA
ncbi:phage major capsid protein [Hyalangium sp.]|uniref:phage major capsid protein n=1 Tax=Hyalangium sp. TaxID=2028555 RepID=UPI002D34F71D|nr:phage major capsid protein [Hyalangium sp.]HYI01368.1 phage major capsid protein [Hyalangium sp.]